MPYKSEAQRRFFNSEEGKKKIGAKEVEHWNEVSKGKKLPEKVNKDTNIYDDIKAVVEDAPREGYLPNNIRKLANQLCVKFSGWKNPSDVRPLWNELSKLGIDDILITGTPHSKSASGGKEWVVNFSYLGTPCLNSRFVYQVYEGTNSLKNEYNMYFS